MRDIDDDAEVFYKLTGMLPPGKSESPVSVGQAEYTRVEVRAELWRLWCLLLEDGQAVRLTPAPKPEGFG